LLKKFTASMIYTFLLLFLLSTGAAAFDYYDYYDAVKLTIGKNTAYVNGDNLTMDGVPYIKADRTMVPLRFISEALDASVDWQPSTRTVLIQAPGGPVIKVVINSKTAYIDNKAKILEAPAEIKGGRTFVPLRFVGEALGVAVDYNNTSKLITLTKVDTSEWNEYRESVTGTTILVPDDWTVEGESTTSSLMFESPEETDFTLLFDGREAAEILKENKEKLLSRDWKLISETGTQIRLTKQNPNVEYEYFTYIVSVRKVDNGCLVVYVDTNSTAQEKDLVVIDQMILGQGFK